MDKFFAVFGKIILMALVGGGLLGAGYFLAKNSGKNLSLTNNLNVQTEATPEATISTPAPKTVSGGLPASAKLSFSAYTISVPSDWTVDDQKDLNVPTDKLILTKGNYTISIFQGATGGAQCVYPGDPHPRGSCRNIYKLH